MALRRATLLLLLHAATGLRPSAGLRRAAGSRRCSAPRCDSDRTSLERLFSQGDEEAGRQPRVVGDKMLRNGPAAGCFRNRMSIDEARAVAKASGKRATLRVAQSDVCGDAGMLRLRDRGGAFKCVDDGLRAAYRSSRMR